MLLNGFYQMGGEVEMDESRREFLKTGAKAVAVATAAERLRTWNTPRTVLGANQRVRVAIIGLRGRGENHIQAYSALPNVEIAALCDIDDSRDAGTARASAEAGLSTQDLYRHPQST